MKYERTHLSFYDQELIDASQKRLVAKGKSQTQRRTPTAQDSTRQGTQSAQELEAQARREQSLANKVADPKLKALISNSAVGKVEAAQALRGRPVDPAQRRYEERMEYGQPHTTLKVKP